MEMRLSLVSIVSKSVKGEELEARCERHDILLSVSLVSIPPNATK